MSFGWSAGDIATAIAVIYNLVEALDSSNGSAGEYRDTISFLNDLKLSLEPLQTFTAWSAYPTYGREVTKQVNSIKDPVKEFIDSVLKYEPSLGTKAKDGRHRHIVRKVEWRVFMSKKVHALRKKIDSHMRIIDTLMQRLTLDVAWTLQRDLPEVLRTTFENTLRPEFITLLRQNLPPLAPMTNDGCPNRVAHDKLSGEPCSIRELMSAIEDIRKQVNTPKITRHQIECCLRGDTPATRQEHVPTIEESRLCPSKTDHDGSICSERQRQSEHLEKYGISLQEVFYLVFLYLGQFLQNLFLHFSQIVTPSRQLAPILLAKYNITFLDAVGSPPRILQYDAFRHCQVLRAFIAAEYRNLSLINQGSYLISSLAGNRFLDDANWQQFVGPGTTILMSALKRESWRDHLSALERCPEPSCPGRWIAPRNSVWVKCPICEKEVHSAAVKLEDHRNFAEPSPSHAPLDPDENWFPASLSTHLRRSTIIGSNEIAIFKRIVRQVVDDANKPKHVSAGRSPTSSQEGERLQTPPPDEEYEVPEPVTTRSTKEIIRQIICCDCKCQAYFNERDDGHAICPQCAHVRCCSCRDV